MTAHAEALETTDPVAGRRSRSMDRWLRRAAAALGVAAVVEAIAILVIGSRGDARFTVGLDPISLGFIGSIVTFPIVGALIAARRPRTVVAWVMIGMGLSLGTGVLTAGYGTIGVRPIVGEPLPLAMGMLVISQLFFVPALGLGTTLLLLLYPTGTFLSPRWRWPAVVAVVAAALWDIGGIFRPGELDPTSLPGLVNPVAAQPPIDAVVAALPLVSNALAAPMVLLAAWSVVLRYRRADPLVRAQIKWFAVFSGIVALALAVSTPNTGPVADIGFAIGVGTLPLLPIAIGIAITRYRLYEIDRLINRALVYGSLTAILAGVFTAGVGLAQRMFVAVTHETSDAAVVGATLVVATLYAPLRKRLEGLVDRRFKFEEARFGAYRDELVRSLTIREPERAAARLAREAVRELELLGGAVLARDDRVVAAAGVWPAEPSVRVPIRHGGEILHAIALGPRRDGGRTSPRDMSDVEALAELVAAAAADGRVEER